METPPEQPPSSVSRRTRWRLRTLTQTSTVLISLAALLVIALQAWIYNEQRKLMNSTQAVMVEQANIMKDGLYINERAYVSVASLVTNMKDGHVTVTFENIGKVPADKIKVKVQAMRQTKEVSIVSTYYFEAGQQLFPGSLKMRVVVPLENFKQAESARILARAETLFVRGTIEYEDGFGIFDTTTFGFEYSPPPNEGWTARSDLIKKTD